MFKRILLAAFRDLKEPRSFIGFCTWMILSMKLCEYLEVDVVKFLCVLIVWNVILLEKSIGRVAKNATELIKILKVK